MCSAWGWEEIDKLTLHHCTASSARCSSKVGQMATGVRSSVALSTLDTSTNASRGAHAHRWTMCVKKLVWHMKSSCKFKYYLIIYFNWYWILKGSRIGDKPMAIHYDAITITIITCYTMMQ